MSKLNDKVAIVTGASKGIGASIARHLADEGAAVVVNYASSKESADHLVAEIIRRGGKAITVQANVANHPRECHQPWRGGNRRPPRGRHGGRRLSQTT